VIQHNGGGTVSIRDFYISGFCKLYRSCGNCDEVSERHVVIDVVLAEDGKMLAGIESNYGDTARINTCCAVDVKNICTEYEGNDTGDEARKIGSGPSAACLYTDADVSAC
jgi:pectate lyase